MNGFTLIADPTRRRILDVLRAQGTDVGGLVDVLHLPQPLVSKHLRALRDAGAVTATVAGKRRVYRLSADPLPDVLAWVLPYQQLWTDGFDRLGRALDQDAADRNASGQAHGEHAHDQESHHREATS
ncbi:MAG: metalloregulator ArsR/SmtB family transcription factor [Actinomycetota bacterium]|nr:metalloregulator ArsR/SmtB family transcription factor [Actinomycetota bacterium]